MLKVCTVLMIVLPLVVAVGNGPRKAQRARINNMRNRDPDSVIFPDHMMKLKKMEDQIPLELARRFNDDLEDLDSFMENIVENKELFRSENSDDIILPRDGLGLASRFGGDLTITKYGAAKQSQKVSVLVAKPAGCLPDPTVVSLSSTDPSVTRVPSCTRLPRCGGCCNHQLLSCQPTQIKMKTLRVYEISGRQYKNYVNVTLEEHIECKCDCAMKASDCRENQIYNEGSCACMCLNAYTDEMYCNMNGRSWNPTECRCECDNEPTECSTGTYFDEVSCRCKRR